MQILHDQRSFNHTDRNSIEAIRGSKQRPGKLNDVDSDAQFISITFLVTMLANSLPSLGLMTDKEVIMNMLALGILIITIAVNVFIQLFASRLYTIPVTMCVLVFSLPWPFSAALTVSASRSILQHLYEESHKSASKHQDKNFSYKGLVRHVKKYWMMNETGNIQFAIASSSVSSAFGVICSLFACYSGFLLIHLYIYYKQDLQFGGSDYKWSIDGIITIQLIGVIVGSIAPIFRCLSVNSHFNFSKKWSKNHLNVFRIEKQWIQRLKLWKHSHVPSHIQSRHCRKVFHNVKNIILYLCIALQISFVVMCNIISLVPRFVLIMFYCCYYFCKSRLKRFREETDASNSDMRSEMEEYSGYVLHTDVEAKLSERILRNTLQSITRLLHESEKKEPRNLMKLLKKSTGFYGVVGFNNDQVPPLHPEETQYSWSLVAVTLTAIALALPNITKGHVKGFLASMSEGLQFVRHIEQSINVNGDLVKARKAAERVWTDVELYCWWLQIDLQKKARNAKKSKQIFHWLGDEAVKIVIHFKRRKNLSLDDSLSKFIAASSMYRISQTILLHCNEQENWPTDEELFEFISTITADLLCACFTNLPRVITMKCHHDAIEKREESIRTTAQLLGKSKKILKILKTRQLPNLDLDSMGYIDKWHALPKNQISNSFSFSTMIRPSSSSSSEWIV